MTQTAFAARSLAVRLWEKIDKRGPNDCWPWTGVTSGGYGQIRSGRGKSMDGKHSRQEYAHRMAYEILVEPVPPGLQLDHLCRNRLCCNPAHLELVTCRQNLLRGDTTWAARNAAKTCCPQGHPFNGIKKDGSRFCRICEYASQKRYLSRHRDMINLKRRKKRQAARANA